MKRWCLRLDRPLNENECYNKGCTDEWGTHHSKFTFDDILALQCCMETVKKVQEDKDLYEKLNDLHGRVYDAYHLENQGEQKPAWSEEDEKMLDYALDMIEWYGGKNEDKSRLVSDWLKSLRPQNTWSR